MIALDNGFEEAVGIVADARASASRLTRALQYVVRHEGPVPAGAMAMLGLGSEARAIEVLLANPDAGRGAIRLLSLEGEAHPPMRDGAQAWDCGGIFDVNIRALEDIFDLHRALGTAGFVSPAPITDWDFGSLAVREVVEKDADGLCIAAMQRVRPPLSGYEEISGNASWVFNSTQIVPDFDAARALFVDHLGWLPVQETDGFAAQTDGANCMGLPPDLASQLPMRIGIYHPHGRMEGSVEIISFGCRANDFSGARPPARGWAALRFPVCDLDDFRLRMERAHCEIGLEVALDWAPHGKVRGLCATTPWGARFEALMRL